MSGTSVKAVAREIIYDALLDDDLFAAVPNLIGASVGARSAVLGWISADQQTRVLAHSGYYTDAQFADYSSNYSHIDPWVTAASQPGMTDRVWNLDDLVSESTFRSTRFYNDWIRAMGDDAYHCLGALTSSTFGTGIIGLHRGKGAAYDRGEDVLLQMQLPDLRRMMALRGRMSSLEAAKQHDGLMLDTLPTCLYLVSRTNVLRYRNAAADKAHQPYWLRSNRAGATHVEHRELAAAIHKATDPAGPSATTVAIAISQGQGAELVSVVPFRNPDGRRLAMLMIAASPAKQSVEHQLRHLFRLTAAEATVATFLAEGRAPAIIAEMRSTSLNTVRIQIKAITAKLGCSRIAEVAVIVSRLGATLPD